MDITLRVREKKAEFELTLKQEENDGRKETNHRPLTHEQGQELRQTGMLPDGIVKKTVNELQVLPPFIYQGDLTTYRIELPYKGCKIMLDYNVFLGTKDHELEVERDEATADEDSVIRNLLQELNIPYIKAKSKRRRFFNAKKEKLENT